MNAGRVPQLDWSFCVAPLYQKCAIIEPSDCKSPAGKGEWCKPHGGTWFGRGGLTFDEIADYVELIARDLRSGSPRTTYEIRYKPDPSAYPGMVYSEFTHAEALLCLDQLMNYARKFPVPWIENGKAVPLQALLTRAAESLLPNQIDVCKKQCDH